MCWGAGTQGEVPPIPVLPAFQHLARGPSPLGDSQDRGTQEREEQSILHWGATWSGIDVSQQLLCNSDTKCHWFYCSVLSMGKSWAGARDPSEPVSHYKEQRYLIFSKVSPFFMVSQNLGKFLVSFSAYLLVEND